jgi:hypothetical protein
MREYHDDLLLQEARAQSPDSCPGEWMVTLNQDEKRQKGHLVSATWGINGWQK